LRASITGEIVLADCVVGDDNLLPNAKGLAGPFGGTHDIHALILGRAQTGIQAFF